MPEATARTLPVARSTASKVPLVDSQRYTVLPSALTASPMFGLRRLATSVELPVTSSTRHSSPVFHSSTKASAGVQSVCADETLAGAGSTDGETATSRSNCSGLLPAFVICSVSVRRSPELSETENEEGATCTTGGGTPVPDSGTANLD